ncbi:hypothetical protein [Cumulibacter manganitolerans]|uniref:hypothetical protein n=1 Tax=Cumulibacter manganitolerans TaxID=1884992 RepID=UPI0012975E67|nr:hypothetical protein [Cumulibacter manganitolerans]
MRLPAPADLVHAVGWVGSTIDTISELVPRAAAVVASAEDLVERVHQLVDRIDLVAARATESVDRADAVLDQAARSVAQADGLVRAATASVTEVGPVIEQAGDAVARTHPILDGAASLTARTSALLDGLEPSLGRLRPTLDALAGSTSPDEVQAMVHLIDTTPALMEALRTDILPMLATLDTVGPDIRDLLMVSKELNEMLGSLPGMGRIKKRVEEEQTTADQAVNSASVSAD